MIRALQNKKQNPLLVNNYNTTSHAHTILHYKGKKGKGKETENEGEGKLKTKLNETENEGEGNLKLN